MDLKTSRFACGIIVAGTVAGTAIAATPESGSVSTAAPKVEWSGETIGGYLLRMPTAVSGSTDTPCEPPMCDTFTLTVDDTANLTIAETLDTDSENAAFTLRITKPDGEVVQTNADPGQASGGKYVKVVIKNAPKGDYVIHHYDNAAATMAFKAYAELAVAPQPVEPAPTATPTTTPQQADSSEAIDLKVAVGKASARKLAKKRKLPVRVTVSRAVTSITAALKKGRKTVGKGSLGATSGTKTLKLKLSRKLKRGAYSLTVVASDGNTATTKDVKVKVSK